MSVASGDVQQRLDEVRARVQEATETARARVEEMRNKIGAGNGLGLGLLPFGGIYNTSGQRGVMIDKIRARSRNRPVLGKFMTPQRRITRSQRTPSRTRKSLANKPHVADDTYAQNSKQNTRVYSQSLNVEI